MMLVVSLDADGAWHLQRAVAVYITRLGREQVPRGLVDVVTAISRHHSPFTAPELDTPTDPMHRGLMSHLDAATRLGVSTRTVSRLVAAGRLVPIGQRITALSVDTLLDPPGRVARPPMNDRAGS